MEDAKVVGRNFVTALAEKLFLETSY